MTFDDIETQIRLIPCGEVRTYSQITPSSCAHVGAVQGNEPDGWHRVVYKDGRMKYPEQRRLLEKEGIEFGHDGKVAPKHFSSS